MLSDLVVKYGKSRQNITGVKVLDGGLLVHGNVDLMQINGIHVKELNRTIVWKDRPATFEHSLVGLVVIPSYFILDTCVSE